MLEVIAGALSGTRLVGYDLSAQAIAMVERSDRVELKVGTPHDVHEHYDLLLSLDVFEHVEDYLGFLRSLQPIADWFVFHIPLDISAQAVVRERPLLAVRSSVGHLHYFTRATALASLQTAGFEIVCDRLLHPSRHARKAAEDPDRQHAAQPGPTPQAATVGANPGRVNASRAGCGSAVTVPARHGLRDWLLSTGSSPPRHRTMRILWLSHLSRSATRGRPGWMTA